MNKNMSSSGIGLNQTNTAMRHAGNGARNINPINFDVYQSGNFTKKQTLGARANSQSLAIGAK